MSDPKQRKQRAPTEPGAPFPAGVPRAPIPRAEHFLIERLDWSALRALLERMARSPLGIAAVREIVPRDDPATLEALDRQRELLALDVAGSRPPGTPLCDVNAILAAARAAHRPLEQEELLRVTQFARASDLLRAWLLELGPKAPACAKLENRLPSLRELGDLLEFSLDEHGEVRDSASAVLARMRSKERSLAAKVSQLLTDMAHRQELRQGLADSSVHRRGGRLVLAVKAKGGLRLSGIVHDRSQSGETIFIEPREVVEMQNQIATLVLDMHAEVHRILVELSQRVFEQSGPLSMARAAAAEIELGRLGVAMAERFGARVPEISSRGLVLRGARHPLLLEEKARGAIPDVVAIDVRLGDEFDLLVITGPNTGGKTLALKTVAVAAMFVRLGLPVCCEEGSRVPLYSGLVADVGDGQEIRANLSTFAAHMARIQEGLKRVDARTLVLLDELGTGTDPDEGAALGAAVLEFLLERGVPTLVTTHIGKLKEFAFRNKRVENASVEFDSETFEPRYRLLVGTPGESKALHIARRLGLPPSIIERAHNRLERRDAQVQALFQDVRVAREEAERLRAKAEAALQELVQKRAAIEQQIAALEHRSAQVEHTAQRDLEARVLAARERISSARQLLPQVPKVLAADLAKILEGAELDLTGATLSDKRRAFLAGLKPGSFVWLARFRKRCLVLQVRPKQGSVRVQLGSSPMDVSFDEVSPSEGG